VNEPVGLTSADAAPPAGGGVDAAADGPGAPGGLGPGQGRPRRRRRWRTALLAVVVVFAVAAGWLVVRGVQAATALVHAQTIVRSMQADVSAASTSVVIARLPDLAKDAARARSATSDPIWWAAARLPGVGPDFAAVATVSAALDDVARAAGPTLAAIDTAALAQGMRGTDGRIDLQPLADAAPALARAASTTAAANASVAGIETRRLAGRLAGPVTQVQDGLTQVSGLLDNAARFAALLPPMLGADGPRTYLLLSLNSAELRTAGGIVGAVAVLRAENGSLNLVDQRTTADFPAVPATVLPLTPAELVVHTDRLGRWLQNTVMTPDFPRTAALVSQMWRTKTGGEVDGVIATDPVAVTYLLQATGAVVEPGGLRLGADNFLSALLHDSYLRLRDPLVADAFYTGVAATIFRAVGSGQGDARQVVQELGRAGGEHRIRVWSAHPAEERELRKTSAGGAFLSGGADDAAGVFLDDGTAGKVDYFLRTTAAVDTVTCDATSTTATVRLTLDYTPPADITAYPRYVTGFSGSDLPMGWVATNLTVYAPVGGTLGSSRLGDAAVGGLLASEGGRQVQVFTSRLAPGQSATYRFQLRTPGRVAALPVWVTPTLTSPGVLAAACP
jgi:hypothetical protein